MHQKAPYIIAAIIFLLGFGLVVYGFLQTNHKKDCQKQNQKYIVETYGTTLGPNFTKEARTAMAEAINKNLTDCLNSEKESLR